MKKNILVVFLAFAILFSSAACGGNNSHSAATEVKGEVNADGVWKPDLSKTIDIELMEKGWVNTPTGGNEKDPYWSWIKDNFNINLKLTNTADFSNTVMVRFASGDAPDIIAFSNANDLRTLYNQGVLLNDWNPYLNKMATVSNNISDDSKKVFTQNDKLICLPGKEETSTYGFRIRKDWLKKLNLDMPNDVNSLLNVARAFTFNDPDGNGKNDTYAFSSAGSGTSIGEISNLMLLWGPNNFYVNSKKKVAHPVVDGTLDSFLSFLKTIYDEKLIDPDWYIQGWEQRKGQMYKGSYGILWYTGALISEIEYNTGNTGATADQWETMPLFNASENGGKYYKGSIATNILTVSAKAAADQDKLSRIVYFLEQVAYPNNGFYKLRYGDGFDYYFDDFVKDGQKTGYKYMNEKNKDKTHYRSDRGVLGSADYGTWIDTDTYKVISNISDSGSKTLLKQIELEEDIVKSKFYDSEGRNLVLDAQTVSDVNTIYDEFMVNYVLGYDKDLKGFKSRWLNGGGQSLLDSAEEQFKKLGYIS